MSPLFISLYLDEDVSVFVAKLLRARGFSVVTTQEASQGACDDEAQLAYAASHGQTILTHNRCHFERLAVRYAGEDRPHAGIIIAVRRKPNEIVGRLLPILNRVAADEMANQVYYV